MAKSPKSKQLRIGVDSRLVGWPEFAELAEKGHDLVEVVADWDILLSPVAWRMDEPLRKYLDNAVKAARKAKGA